MDWATKALYGVTGVAWLIIAVSVLRQVEWQ